MGKVSKEICIAHPYSFHSSLETYNMGLLFVLAPTPATRIDNVQLAGGSTLFNSFNGYTTTIYVCHSYAVRQKYFTVYTAGYVTPAAVPILYLYTRPVVKQL